MQLQNYTSGILAFFTRRYVELRSIIPLSNRSMPEWEVSATPAQNLCGQGPQWQND